MSYGRPPQTLYHYTSPEALAKIVESGVLHCSSAHYLNDISEVEYASTLAARRLRKYMDDYERRDPRIDDDEALLRGFIQDVEGFPESDSPMFVSCLSREADILSQWRAYCPDEGGFAIGFSSEDLQRLAESQGFKLVRCIYKRERQHERMDELAADMMEAYQEARDQDAPVGSDLFREHDVEFWKRFHPLAAAFKHPSFCKEKEWRLVADESTAHQAEVHYRPGPSTPIPYIHFSLRGQGQQRLPISRILIGPTAEPNLARRTAEMILREYGAPGAEVEESVIPYRTW